MRTPEHDYRLYTVPTETHRRLVAEPPLDVEVSQEDGLYVARVPALTGDRPSFGTSVESMQADVRLDISAAWRFYVDVEPETLAPDAIELRNTLLKAFRVEHISIEHPDADTAHFIVDGIAYTVKRETVRDGIKMLTMEDAFYQRFGRGDDELPLIRGSFWRNDKRLRKQQ
jgi:hypothetical protein